MKNMNHPKCTHCGYEFDDEETWYGEYMVGGKVHVGDGDTSELICPNDDCKKKFWVKCVHHFEFENINEDEIY
jgi:hypothetical protein